MTGRVVALSGVDGAGKSTIAAALAERARHRGERACVLKVPLFSNPAYDRFRPTLAAIADVDDDAYLALRGALVTLEAVRFIREDVAPAADRHDLVVCDRHLESIEVYLEVRHLDGAPLAMLAADMPRPDVHVHLEVPLEVAMERLVRQGEDAEAKRDFMARTHAGLRSRADEAGATVIDATMPVDDVVAAVESTISASMVRSR